MLIWIMQKVRWKINGYTSTMKICYLKHHMLVVQSQPFFGCLLMVVTSSTCLIGRNVDGDVRPSLDCNESCGVVFGDKEPADDDVVREGVDWVLVAFFESAEPILSTRDACLECTLPLDKLALLLMLSEVRVRCDGVGLDGWFDAFGSVWVDERRWPIIASDVDRRRSAFTWVLFIAALRSNCDRDRSCEEGGGEISPWFKFIFSTTGLGVAISAAGTGMGFSRLTTTSLSGADFSGVRSSKNLD